MKSGGPIKINIITLGVLFFISCGCQIRSIPDSSDDTEDILTFYKNQSVISNPGIYNYLYKDLPSQPESLAKVAQGVLIHVYHLESYGITLSEERKSQVHLRKVEDILSQMEKYDDRLIKFPREPSRRVVVNCRHFALLLCSMLRHTGTAARARCGFATYFNPGYYVDHWICEYWNSAQNRWIQIDSQLDSIQKKKMYISFDEMDLPKNRFFNAGEVWQLCRTDKLNPLLCGILDYWGLWFIKSNVMRDFLSLNKVELLPWDTNPFIEKSAQDTTEETTAFYNNLALINSNADQSIDELRSYYGAHSEIQMPSDWKP
jgi:hypothetical protein